ncbi:MAG: tetratricopeptide repeat protein [Calothrix sp. SM1_7_51]|nr:tetratricopeptide repeat protein [Calothrix sp. SM1_7_51]
MYTSSARQYFHLEIQQPDESIDLVKAALYISQEEYPDLCVEDYIDKLEDMASEVERWLPSSRYPLRIIQAINEYLYEELGFTGNTENYHDERNSFLNDVLERRKGIPITLSLVYLEIARRINFPMVGVGMPGHFLIRPNINDMEIYVDAFNGGEILFPQDCQQRLEQVFERSVTLKPEFLATVTNKYFLLRMLNNLKQIYLKHQNLEKSLAVVDRMLLLFPDLPEELRDRGLLYYQIGQFTKAADDLETYLLKNPFAQDAFAIRKLLSQLGRE